MAGRMVYRYVGRRNANGGPLDYVAGVPARDLDEDDVAALPGEALAMLEAPRSGDLGPTYEPYGEAPPEQEPESEAPKKGKRGKGETTVEFEPAGETPPAEFVPAEG